MKIGDTVWIRQSQVEVNVDTECPVCKGHAHRMIDGARFTCQACKGVGFTSKKEYQKREPVERKIVGLITVESHKAPFGFDWDKALSKGEDGMWRGQRVITEGGEPRMSEVFRTREEAMM